MKNLSFKYYPVSVLIIIFCIIEALYFGLKGAYQNYWMHTPMGFVEQVICILFSSGFVISLLTIINKYLMWKPWLKVLGICDLRGVYTGKLRSSYHIDDDPAKPFIELYCRIQVYQNINGVYISGEFYSDEKMTQRSSWFKAPDVELRQLDNGIFRLYYLFSSKGELLHKYHAQYGLNSHEGVCVLEYHPAQQTLEGYYFTHERGSHGTLSVTRQV